MVSLAPSGRTQALLGLLRILVALLFLQHGTAKLFGFPHVAMFDGLKLVSLLGLAGAIEIVGGLLLLLGLFTRPTAVVLAAEMVAAYLIGHAARGALPIHNGGELAFVYGVVFLLFALAGPGRFAIDRSFHEGA
ncbi:DoxX family protein [Methylosinus sp. H3A]|uniref:DoxX family protein n=1 Tax=Methylosinus sp. H3A TaxID=2785786 RepID=UPI0018C25F12|nr:DoxX family protein [Methylosinus sp. H3A]MBG0808554.1 DoxX family protein [Methylosinus sp. H3A]